MSYPKPDGQTYLVSIIRLLYGKAKSRPTFVKRLRSPEGRYLEHLFEFLKAIEVILENENKSSSTQY